MPIGIRDEVRDLCGIYDTNDLPDSRIDKAIDYGKGELYSLTFKTDWDTDTTHPLYKKAEELVHYYASAFILDRFSGNQEKANLHNERATQKAAELKQRYEQWSLVNASADPSTQKFSVATSKYKTYPLNPDAEIPRSKTIIPGD